MQASRSNSPGFPAESWRVRSPALETLKSVACRLCLGSAVAAGARLYLVFLSLLCIPPSHPMLYFALPLPLAIREGVASYLYPLDFCKNSPRSKGFQALYSAFWGLVETLEEGATFSAYRCPCVRLWFCGLSSSADSSFPCVFHLSPPLQGSRC